MNFERKEIERFSQLEICGLKSNLYQEVMKSFPELLGIQKKHIQEVTINHQILMLSTWA